jgi:hypothetical protein
LQALLDLGAAMRLETGQGLVSGRVQGDDHLGDSVRAQSPLMPLSLMALP